jgi:alpha-1,3-glucan synthase
MPGWYFTVESMSAKHLTSQFKIAIQDAISSSTETRAKMRAASAKQRFPVAQWVEDLGKLHTTSIDKSKKRADKGNNLLKSGLLTPNPSRMDLSDRESRAPSPVPQTPGGLWAPPSPYWDDNESIAPSIAGLPQPGFHRRRASNASNLSLGSVINGRTDFALQKVDPFFTDEDGNCTRAFKKKLEGLGPKNSETELCIEDYLVKSEKKWFESYKYAKLGLGISSRNNSKVSLSDGAAASPRPSTSGGRRASLTVPQWPLPSRSHAPPNRSDMSVFETATDYGDDRSSVYSSDTDGAVGSGPVFDFGNNYAPISGLKKLMLRKVLGWPIYTIVLAFGQILAANSYQITLLNGELGQTATMLYIIATVYAVTSVGWWIVFRRFKSVWTLSTPFGIYGAAFLCVGCAPFSQSALTRGWVQKIATCFYATAASSGSMYFALNFGDEGKSMAPMRATGLGISC